MQRPAGGHLCPSIEFLPGHSALRGSAEVLRIASRLFCAIGTADTQACTHVCREGSRNHAHGQLTLPRFQLQTDRSDE